MSTPPSLSDVSEARALRVSVTDDALVVELVDGRTIAFLSRGILDSRMAAKPNAATGGLSKTAKGYPGPIWTKTSASKALLQGGVPVKHSRRCADGLKVERLANRSAFRLSEYWLKCLRPTCSKGHQSRGKPCEQCGSVPSCWPSL